MLADAGLYKDAVCLARLRLPPQHDVIKQLFQNWAETQAKDLNLEPAAKW